MKTGHGGVRDALKARDLVAAPLFLDAKVRETNVTVAAKYVRTHRGIKDESWAGRHCRIDTENSSLCWSTPVFSHKSLNKWLHASCMRDRNGNVQRLDTFWVVAEASLPDYVLHSVLQSSSGLQRTCRCQVISVTVAPFVLLVTRYVTCFAATQ